MNEKGKALLRVTAPVLVLLFLALGMRLLPALQGRTTPDADASAPPVLLRHKPRQGDKDPRPIARREVPRQVIADPKLQQALQQIATSQMAAFARDDYAAALRFADPDMQKSWTPDLFRQMIQSEWGPLTAKAKATFAHAHVDQDTAFLPVTLTNAAGRSIGYIYTFHRQSGEPDQGTATSVPRTPQVWYVESVRPLPRGEDEFPGMEGLPPMSPPIGEPSTGSDVQQARRSGRGMFQSASG